MGALRPQHSRRGGAGAATRHSDLRFPQQLWCERVNPENKAALEAWVRETGIRLVQVNGQRKYGGPPPGTLVRPDACRGAALASTSPWGGTGGAHSGSPQSDTPNYRSPLPQQTCPARPLEGASFQVYLLCASPILIQLPNYANDSGYGCCTHFTDACSHGPTRAGFLGPDPARPDG